MMRKRPQSATPRVLFPANLNLIERLAVALAIGLLIGSSADEIGANFLERQRAAGFRLELSVTQAR